MSTVDVVALMGSEKVSKILSLFGTYPGSGAIYNTLASGDEVGTFQDLQMLTTGVQVGAGIAPAIKAIAKSISATTLLGATGVGQASAVLLDMEQMYLDSTSTSHEIKASSILQFASDLTGLVSSGVLAKGLAGVEAGAATITLAEGIVVATPAFLAIVAGVSAFSAILGVAAVLAPDTELGKSISDAMASVGQELASMAPSIAHITVDSIASNAITSDSLTIGTEDILNYSYAPNQLVVTSTSNSMVTVTTKSEMVGSNEYDLIVSDTYTDSTKTVLYSETTTEVVGANLLKVSTVDYNPGGTQCTYDEKLVDVSGGQNTTVSEVSGNESFAGVITSATISGSQNEIDASGLTVNVLQDGSASIFGNNNTANLASDSFAEISGTGNLVNSSDNTVELDQNSSAIVVGSGNDVYFGGSNATLTSTGNNVANLISGYQNDVITSGSGSNTVTESRNSSLIDNGNNDAINVLGNAALTVNGIASVSAMNNSNISVGSTGAVNFFGNGSTLTLAQDGYADVAGTNNVVRSSDGVISLEGNTSVTILGSDNDVYLLGSGDTLTSTNNTVQDGLRNLTDETITSGSMANTVVETYGSSLTDNGTSENITVSNNEAVTVNGDATITATNDSLINVGANGSAALYASGSDVAHLASGASLILQHGTATVDTAGDDTLILRGGTTANVVGGGNDIAFWGSNANLYSIGNTVEDLGSNDKNEILTGANNTVSETNGSSLTDEANGDQITINGDGTVQSINNDGANTITFTDPDPGNPSLLDIVNTYDTSAAHNEISSRSDYADHHYILAQSQWDYSTSTSGVDAADSLSWYGSGGALLEYVSHDNATDITSDYLPGSATDSVVETQHNAAADADWTTKVSDAVIQTVGAKPTLVVQDSTTNNADGSVLKDTFSGGIDTFVDTGSSADDWTKITGTKQLIGGDYYIANMHTTYGNGSTDTVTYQRDSGSPASFVMTDTMDDSTGKALAVGTLDTRSIGGSDANAQTYQIKYFGDATYSEIDRDYSIASSGDSLSPTLLTETAWSKDGSGAYREKFSASDASNPIEIDKLDGTGKDVYDALVSTDAQSGATTFVISDMSGLEDWSTSTVTINDTTNTATETLVERQNATTNPFGVQTDRLDISLAGGTGTLLDDTLTFASSSQYAGMTEQDTYSSNGVTETSTLLNPDANSTYNFDKITLTEYLKDGALKTGSYTGTAYESYAGQDADIMDITYDASAKTFEDHMSTPGATTWENIYDTGYSVSNGDVSFASASYMTYTGVSTYDEVVNPSAGAASKVTEDEMFNVDYLNGASSNWTFSNYQSDFYDPYATSSMVTSDELMPIVSAPSWADYAPTSLTAFNDYGFDYDMYQDDYLATDYSQYQSYDSFYSPPSMPDYDFGSIDFGLDSFYSPMNELSFDLDSSYYMPDEYSMYDPFEY